MFTYPNCVVSGVPTAVSHGLWMNNYDYDAPTQLLKVHERNVAYVDMVQTVPHGTLYPLCSMNVAFDRDLIGPALMQGLMGEGMPWGRYDDMFSGWASKVIGDHIGVGAKSGAPYVLHNKASNPFTNLAKEYMGIIWQERIIRFFSRLRLSEASRNSSTLAYLELADKIQYGLADLSPYFVKLSYAMRKWTKYWESMKAGTLRVKSSRSSKGTKSQGPVSGDMVSTSSSFEFTKRPTFDGDLTLESRSVFLDPKSPVVPCGFVNSTDLDPIVEQFSQDTQCSIVILSVVFGTPNDYFAPVLQRKSDECYVAIVDEKYARNELCFNKSFPSGLQPNETWQLFILKSLPYSNGAVNARVIKFLAPRLFPNAQWVIYHDAKTVLNYPPSVIVSKAQDMLPKGIDVAIEKPPEPTNRTVEVEIKRTIGHMRGRGDPDEVLKVVRLRELFVSEGFLNRTRNDYEVVNTHFYVYRRSQSVTRYFCAIVNMVILTTHREQCFEYYVRQKLNMAIYNPAVGLLCTDKGHGCKK